MFYCICEIPQTVFWLEKERLGPEFQRLPELNAKGHWNEEKFAKEVLLASIIEEMGQTNMVRSLGPTLNSHDDIVTEFFETLSDWEQILQAENIELLEDAA